MHRVGAVFVLVCLFLVSPALALQEAGKPGGTAVDAKKAHEAIKKHVESKDGKVGEETKLYDDMVEAGVPPAEALEAVKNGVDEEVDAGKMRAFIKEKKKAGLKGKKLAAAIKAESKARAEANRKKRAEAGKKGSGKKDGGFIDKEKKGKGKRGEGKKGKGEKGDDDDDGGDEKEGDDDGARKGAGDKNKR